MVARVCGGGLGRARTFDLAAYLAARQDALTVLGPAMGAKEHSDLFRRDRYVSRRSRWEGEDGAIDPRHLFLARGHVIPAIGYAGAGAKSGHSGGIVAHGRRR